MKKRASIIIPVYNVEKYIENCLLSAVNQSYENLEIIIVDDDSPDLSNDVIQNIVDSKNADDLIIKVIHNETNEGLSKTREIGLKHSSGDYILFLDGDDSLYDRATLSDGIKQLETTDSDIVIFDFNKIYSNRIERVPCDWHKSKKQLFEDMILRKTTCNIWGKIFRRELFHNDDINFDQRIGLGEDFAIVPKLIYFSKEITYMPNRILYNYNCQNINSYTRQGLNNRGLKSMILSIESIRNFLHKYRLLNLISPFITINKLILYEETESKNWDYINNLWPEVNLDLSRIDLKHRLFSILIKHRVLWTITEKILRIRKRM